MTFDYAKTSATALSLLTKFGADVTVTRVTTGTYDPATGTNAVTTSTATVKGVVLDFGAGVSMVGGNMVTAGDKRLVLEAAAAPDMNDRFTANGKTYAPVSIGEVNPAGVAVLFDLHIRSN